MGKVGEQGWLGITWPKEWGGQEGDGVYEYLLNEALAGRGGPQIGKGVVIRVGLPEWTSKLADGNVAQVTRNIVDILRDVEPRIRSTR